MRRTYPVLVLAFCLLLPAQAQVVVERTVSVAASPLQAYNAFALDWQIKQWSGAAGVVSDARPGGVWRLTYANGSLEEGVFDSVARPADLGFTFLLNDRSTYARISFTGRNDSTDISIRHTADVTGRQAATVEHQLTFWWDMRLLRIIDYLARTPGGYTALPTGTGPFPAVLVLHDRFGVSRTVRAFCDSLAAAGYVAQATDMFKGDITSDLGEAARYLELVRSEEALAAAQRGADALRARPDVNPKKTAVWGLGFGGDVALSLCTADPKLRACAAWHATMLPSPDLLKRIACPVFAVFGEWNVHAPRPQVQEFSAALVQAAVRVETVIVPGSSAFSDPAYGEEYSSLGTTDAWRRTLMALDKRLRL